MNIEDAKNEVLINAEAGNASLVVSGSGMGKSQMGWQAYRKYCADNPTLNIGYGQIFLATQTPPDLIGYQFKGERTFEMEDGSKRTIAVTDPSVPLWMISVEGKPAFMYDRFWLTIDEYGQGESDTKKAGAEILLNGGTAPWYLPEGSIRVAMSNEGSRYGVTKDFDFCIARRTLIKVHPDADATVRYWDKPYTYQGQQWQMEPWIKVWALQNPTILFEPEPKEQGPWCNPRTACAGERYLQVKAKRNGGTIPTDDLTTEMLAGTIGMGAAASMMGFLQFRLQLPSYEDVVADPEGIKVPKKADLLLLMAYELAGRAKKEHLAECIEYVQRMPKDMAVTFVSALLRRDYKAMIQEPAMQTWINKNAALVSIIAGLAQ